MIVDHRDCGFYKAVYGTQYDHDRKLDTNLHCYHLIKIRNVILDKYPYLNVTLYLMDFDGSVKQFIPNENLQFAN